MWICKHYNHAPIAMIGNITAGRTPVPQLTFAGDQLTFPKDMTIPGKSGSRRSVHREGWP